jgi:hypothetical protein
MTSAARPNGVGESDLNDFLAHVEMLERQGHALEAIDALTAANRQSRRTELERRLVRLRSDAFLALDRSHGPAHWPVWPPGHPLPARRAPPVVEAGQLTAQVLSTAILRHGCLHVRRVVPDERVAELVAGIDRAFAAAEAFETGADASETAPWFEPFRPSDAYPKPMGRQVGNRRRWVREADGVWAADSPRMLYELFEVFDAVGLRRVVTEYLGERPALAVDKCTLRRVGLDTSTNWHQDGAFLASKGEIHTVNVWMSLSHCGVDAPGLDVVPKRLDGLAETGTRGASFRWSVGHPVVEDVAGDAGICRPVFEPGDVLLFDENFLHRTAIDSAMTRERYAIETWFFAPSVYPEQYVPLVV